MKPRLLLLLCSLFILSACALAQTPPAPDSATPAKPTARVFTKDMIVYVSDFELDAQNVKTDSGGIVNQVRPGILQRPRKQAAQDPELQARKLVSLMSASIIADLQKAGYRAARLATGDPLPASGAWVHGVFADVDEGNRLHRAVIGFGSGAANMQLFVRVTDLRSPEKPLYESSQEGTSGKKPGAVITLNPYVAAAKFVMGKDATEKTVKKTASQITAEIVKRLKECEPPPAAK
jgi:hypothetical protein